MHFDRRFWTLATLLSAAGCAPDAGDTSEAAALPRWTWDSTMVFPADRSLLRPEDGIALADGRLIMSDQQHGLRLVERDGSSKPFGELVAKGYAHHPPDHNGGANGVALEPGGTHLLRADVFGGAIYRVDVSSGATEKLYQHRYGINTAVRDSRGAIWFTQSAQNTPEAGEARMWATVDIPRARHSAFRSLTPAQQEVMQEFMRRGQAGVSRMELCTPAVWAPLPGAITGVIGSPGGGPVYLTGLGNAVVKLTR